MLAAESTYLTMPTYAAGTWGGRDLQLALAHAHLRDYVRAVSGALEANGCIAVATLIPLGDCFGAQRSITACAELGSASELDERNRACGTEAVRSVLSWAEDEGWSASHCCIAASAAPRRYLHSSLVPEPAEVARFVRDTLTDPEAGTVYPARFRDRGQPLGPVLEQLAQFGCRRPQQGSTVDPCIAGNLEQVRRWA